MSLQTEFEIKFFVTDRDTLISKLLLAGAQQIYPQKLMRRVNIDPIAGYTGKKRARVRDEGDKITCTFKSVGEDTSRIDCVQEVEVTLSNFDDMIAIFKWLGVDYKNYQETKREKRSLQTPEGEIELCLDIRPGVPEFIEIEWPNQAIVEHTAQAFGFDISVGFFWSADLIYDMLNICTADELNHWKDLKFDNYPGM